MPITILDVVKHYVGEKEVYTGQEFVDCGRPMLGGCFRCGATIAGYNMCPTKSGFVACRNECVEDDGFETVEELLEWEASRLEAVADWFTSPLDEGPAKEDEE